MGKEIFLKYKSKFLESDKNIKVIVISGFLAIILLFASQFTKKDETNIDIKNVHTENSLEYIEYMENKIHKMVSSINGVGNLSVMVTLESSEEYIYAQEEKKNSDLITSNNNGDFKNQQKDTYEERIIVIDKNGNKNALIKKKLEPQVKGVVIVCDGINDSNVKSNIYEAVKTAFDISLSRVSVIEGKN
ncbi:MAG: hypothetical protein ACRCZK_02335 [Oscillospiraceae bacterium]